MISRDHKKNHVNNLVLLLSILQVLILPIYLQKILSRFAPSPSRAICGRAWITVLERLSADAKDCKGVIYFL